MHIPPWRRVVFVTLVAACAPACGKGNGDGNARAVPSASSGIEPMLSSSAVGGIAATRRTSLPTPAVRDLLLLYTADEHGWMLPHGTKGGAISLLHQWTRTEGYCVPDRPGACDEHPSFALSGGDNWTGPAVSSYLRGKPMAEAMRTIGYLHAALGNHELDYGQQNVIENAKVQGYDFLSANLHWDSSRPQLPVQPWVILRRNQVDIGVIGLTTTFAPTHLLPSSYEGLTFEEEEAALIRTVPEVWKAGADLVIVIAHVCPDVMQHIVGKHPEWNLTFVGAAHCHALKALHGGKTPVFEPAAELSYYVRVPITVDLARPQGQRVLKAEPALVEIGSLPAKAAMSAPVRGLHDQIMQNRDAARDKLGEVLGYSQRGIGRETPSMVKWLLGAWRKQLKADVALMNKHGMRQDLGSGDIRMATLWDILPFEYKLVTMKLTGKDLIDNATCCDALMDGVRKSDDRWLLSDGRTVDPAATYRVVTPDYTYLGGAGFHFKSQAIEPEVGEDWRDAIADWMRAHRTTVGKPLESILYR